MAMCLLHGLHEGKGLLDLDKIAYYFVKWIKSFPFDMGATTRAALGRRYHEQPNPYEIISNVKEDNYYS
jgi:ADP-ribosylglycohydrolase